MRLSEAMRLGMPFVKDDKHVFLYKDCGCAIGAALWAIGYRDVWSGGNVCRKEWPWTTRMSHELQLPRLDIASEISHRHYWQNKSRSDIANWIETLENQYGITDGQVSKEVTTNVEEGEYVSQR
jgi:hypothetical protein